DLLFHQLIAHGPAAGALDDEIVARLRVSRGVADDALHGVAHLLGRDRPRYRERQEIRRHHRDEANGAEIDEIQSRIALVDVVDDQVRLVVEQALPRTGYRLEMQVQ